MKKNSWDECNNSVATLLSPKMEEGERLKRRLGQRERRLSGRE